MMSFKTMTLAAASLIVAVGLAGPSLAAEALDQLKPIDDAGLASVQGPTGLAKKQNVASNLAASDDLSQTKTSLDGMAAVESANTNNTLGVGIISLNNATGNSALSLSNSLLNAAGKAGP